MKFSSDQILFCQPTRKIHEIVRAFRIIVKTISFTSVCLVGTVKLIMETILQMETEFRPANDSMEIAGRSLYFAVSSRKFDTRVSLLRFPQFASITRILIKR